MFKPSKKFQLALSGYLEWAKCRTPFTGTFAAEKIGANVYTEPIEHAVGAAEAIFRFETHGLPIVVVEEELELCHRYALGKANKDWWFKEIGIWGRGQTPFIPEEFINMLMPLCFIDLFGYGPSTARVREFFDNNYSVEDFTKDMKWLEKGFEIVPGGVVYKGVIEKRILR